MAEPTITPVKYMVTGLPDDSYDHVVWSLDIEYTGHGMWALRHMSRCLNFETGEWDHEPIPSSRTDEWLADHRRPYPVVALAALREYPKLVINGLRVEDGRLVPA